MKQLKIILLFSIIFFYSCNKDNEPKKSERLNVLFLIADDLNCDLGAYHHPKVISPNIDRLASEGILFENAHNQYPLCGPSRASFMTGMYPDQTKITRNNVLIRNCNFFIIFEDYMQTIRMLKITRNAVIRAVINFFNWFILPLNFIISRNKILNELLIFW